MGSPCHLCNKRKAERFCPAVGAKICAICCGTEREVSLDCPSDCSWLIAARRYEESHRPAGPPREFSFPGVNIHRDFLADHEEAIGRLMAELSGFAAINPALRDSEAVDALTALAESYRTLQSGIYFERPPAMPLARALYDDLVRFIAAVRQEQSARPGVQPWKDSEVFLFLVFLVRLAEISVNGRPRSRAFLDSLRRQFPVAGPSAADGRPLPSQSLSGSPRIIIP